MDTHILHINYVLGLSTDATALSRAAYGQGSGPIVLDDVRCTGTEDRLVDCPYDPSTVDCVHSEDASVRCLITCEYNSTSGSIT